MQKGIHLFTFKDIPVSLNFSFLVLILILSVMSGSLVGGIFFGINAVLAVLLHEFGHALTARHYGYHPEILLTGLGGLTTHEHPTKWKQDLWITIAGPGVGLVLGGILYVVLFYVGPLLGFPAIAYEFFGVMMWINLVWGVFNLIPARPMDGSKVLMLLLGKYAPRRGERIFSIVSFVCSVLIVVAAILFQSLFMVFIGGYLAILNFGAFREALGSGGKKPKDSINLEAARLYESGKLAARNGNWSRLKQIGYQMRDVATDPADIAEAYELLTVACTNLEEYQLALDHSKHARQSKSVTQAAARCRSMLGIK